MLIDTFNFARQSLVASGMLVAAKMARIERHDGDGELNWRLAGSIDRDGRLFLELTVRGQIPQCCQRCLATVRVPVDIASRLEVVADRAIAERAPLDNDEFDVIVGSDSLDVAQLVEDEIILALPGAPRHDNCTR